MKLKVTAIAILAAAAVLVALALSLDLGSNGQSANSVAGSANTGEAQTTASPSDSASTDAPVQPSESDSTGTPGDEAEPRAEATRPSWDPQPTETDARLEVPDPTESGPSGLPKSQERQPVFTKAPKDATAEGKLVAGFPKRALPLPEGTEVVRSLVENQQGLVMAGVEARSQSDEGRTLEFYRQHFEENRWPVTESKPAEGTTQLRAEYGNESMTVTVRQLPTGVTAITAAGAYRVEK